MKDLFKMGGTTTKNTNMVVALIGFFVLFLFWYLISTFSGISSTILPSPVSVIKSIFTLESDYDLIKNSWFSIKLNFYGYVEAILIALPVGFLIGLFPVCRSLLSGYVNAMRFLPLTAVTGIFIAWFGIELDMKIHFLSFGILIYLLPVIVQRIDEIDKIHLQTIHTIGASNFQKFKHVYLPSVISRISDDIRVMVAISWTYIIVAELINKEGGVGAMIFTATKQSRMDMVFAILLVIIFIGFLQDALFKFLDRIFFPYKYETSQIKVNVVKDLISNTKSLIFKK